MSNRKWKLTTAIHPATYRGGDFSPKKLSTQKILGAFFLFFLIYANFQHIKGRLSENRSTNEN